MKKRNKFIIYIILFIILISIFSYINISEYNSYNKNYNEKLGYIVDYIKANTELTDAEIIEMINSDTNTYNLLKKYNYDITNTSAIEKNNDTFKKYFIIEIIVISSFIILILTIYTLKNIKRNKDIKKIIDLIDNINHHKYDIEIDTMSENEISLLKNEIYKTTIMLRSIADTSLKDKENLKKSLEDISHQLKTPLTSIMINLDNLLDNPDMDVTKRNTFIKKIKKEIYNIKNLVSSILKLSQFDVNTIDFIREEIDVNELIDLSIEKVSSLADLKNIVINVNGNKKDTIYCDRIWEVEAISNILKNALEHSSNDSNVDIEYSNNKVYEKIVIRNYGSTIKEEDIKHLFERFYKGSNSNSDSVGIGLSLAKNIVLKDNGNIYVESKNNVTEFIIKYFKEIK